MKLIDTTSNKLFHETQVAESVLCDFLQKSWEKIFPHYTLIKREFYLKGNVRDIGKSGRIDFFAYNILKKRFVIIEVKKDSGKNIRSQIFDYLDYIEDNYDSILNSTQNILPDVRSNNSKTELVFFASSFKPNEYQRIEKIDYPISLFSYKLFSNRFLTLYINNNSFDNTPTTNNKESISIEEADLKEFWNILLLLIKSNTISPNREYRIEGNELIMNVGVVYNKYASQPLKKENCLYSLNQLRKQLRKCEEFNRVIGSVRYGNEVRNGYAFDLKKLRKNQNWDIKSIF